jgi:tRNA(adenine34) deaminase
MMTHSKETDERFMRRALAEARKAAEQGEVPVGAVVVKNGVVFASGYNRLILKNDPTAHAEIMALRKAARKLKNYRLLGTTLYVTIEPCAMCLGAAIQARIGRLVFGALDPKAGAVSSIIAFPMEKTNHRLQILGGILEDECGRIIRDFFKAKRGQR